ncbi:MAG: hypothetical protein OXE99_09010 [Cellvibrionales bacterium]|nr:hypothetical protein [Cellvibrionales bacterium]
MQLEYIHLQCIVLTLILAIYHSHSQKFENLSEACFLNNCSWYTKYPPHSTTVVLLNNQYPSIDFINSLNNLNIHGNFMNKHHIIEFDKHSHNIKINGETYCPNKHDLNEIFSCKFISCFGNQETEYIQKTLSDHYGIDLELIVNAKTNQLLESKTNTQEAINVLKKKYADNKEMTHYLDLFLVKGGIIENECELISALQENQDHGIVLKTPGANGGSGVLILTANDVQSILNSYYQGKPSDEYLTLIKQNPAIINHLIHQQKIAWQKYIAPECTIADRALQFNINNEITPFFTVSGFMIPPFYLGDKYRGETIDQVLNDLTEEEKNAFYQIIRELMDEKAKLGGENISGIFDEQLQLKSFDSSALLIKESGRVLPKIYEINARLPASASILEAIQHDVKNTMDNTGYLWVLTPDVYLPENMLPERAAQLFVKTLDEFRALNPDYHIDFGRILCPNDLKTIKAYLIIRPVAEVDNGFWHGRAAQFSALLTENFSTN